MKAQKPIKFAFLNSTAFLMACVGGFTDVVGFVGINKLFTAHITGNIVVVIAELINHTPGVASKVIALPLFILLAILVTIFIEKYGQTKALLAFWFAVEAVLLASFMYIGLVIFPHISVVSGLYIFGAMLMVAAMAIHNTLMRTFMLHFPACTVMTGNLMQFVVDLVSYFGGRRLEYNIEKHKESLKGIKRHGNVLAGFALGGLLAAFGYYVMGFWSIAFDVAVLIFMAIRCLELV